MHFRQFQSGRCEESRSRSPTTTAYDNETLDHLLSVVNDSGSLALAGAAVKSFDVRWFVS